MRSSFTVKRQFQNGRGRRPRQICEYPSGGRVPRISRLMALAIQFDKLLSDGVVADQADLARLGYVSRARITQILNLLCLAPDIQENLLELVCGTPGGNHISERSLRPIAGEP